MDRLFAAAAAAKTGKPPRRNPPQPVYKVKNPRPFPPGRLEMVIAEQRSNMGRDVLISPWVRDPRPIPRDMARLGARAGVQRERV
jgi:hypothetical protein